MSQQTAGPPPREIHPGAVRRPSSLIRHLRVLRAVAQGVSHSLDIQEVIDRSVTALTEVTGHEMSSLHLVSPDGDRLLLRGERGLSRQLREVNLALPLGKGLIGSVAVSGVPRRVDDAAAERDLLPAARAAVVADGIRAFVCVPIRARQRILGTVSLGRQTGRRFTDEEVSLLECAADQIGLALDNARLHAESQRHLADMERARTAVVRAERLSAVGELASGVAHEINNPLTIILAQTHLLLDGQHAEEVDRGLRTVEAAARRAATTVKDLVCFAEPRRARRAPCDLAELVERVLGLHEPRFQAEHILARVEAGELPLIWGDAEQIQQVLVNLVDNARHAMAKARGGGALTVRLAQTHLGVRIEVADDGPGIAPEHLPRIFTPFFTTKGPDEGRGLGLSVATGIVREHHGRLWAENRPEGGARFVVELPLSLRSADSPPRS